MKYALKLIFLKCIFEFMINTAPTASNSVYGREKLFWYDKINFSNHVTVVQWSRRCLHVQINRVRLPATLFNVSLYSFCFLFGLFFNTIFPFGLFSLFLLLTLPVMHLDQWYFKKLNLPFVHRLNHPDINIITLKSPLGLPPKNN